jgi:hypothetical protein
MKTSELTGAALDWAVAKCEGKNEIRVFAPHCPTDRGWIEVRFNPEPRASTARYDPSDNWFFGGPIIERHPISIASPSLLRDEWRAMIDSESKHAWTMQDGPTPLVAAMRCYVESKMGEEIDVPEELK